MSDALRTVSSFGRVVLGRLGLFDPRRRAAAVQATAQPRGRLFRKYVLLIVGLVSLVLLLNSALDFWFGYDENKAALFRIQQEKAASAARRIEQFVDEIERQLGWTTAPQWAASPLEQRRFDYVRLLRQVPAITELIQLDEAGKEQLKVSRLAMDVVGSEKDYSRSPGFNEARQQRVWFSPVYFRKESEPYMTMAVARAGRTAGVTIAEVNLKLIWDVITGLKIGEHGYAYVVDRDGRLIAHPDISLVLRNTNLSSLPQVAAARAEASGEPAASSTAMVAGSLYGNRVLTAHAAIAPLGWTVFVELPLNEALAPLYGSALRTAALLVLALVLATLAALLLARRMTVPIRELQAGAARIGAGELDRRIDIHTGDELEGLAGEFNRMAVDLQKSYADLEKKVEDRTAELKESLDQQTATSEVLGVINSSPGHLAPVFDALLEKATTLCEAAHGQLAIFDGDRYRTVAARGDPGFVDFVLNRGPVLPGPGTVMARVHAGEATVYIDDVAATEAYRPSELVRRANELGRCRTMLGVALGKGDRLVGSIIVYRQEVRTFSDKQIALLQNFAAQAVIAMENARLLTETREALEQQTATVEVLGVINSSPGELAPVFDAMLEKAMHLCTAAFGYLMTYDGSRFHAVAHRGLPPPFAAYLPMMDQPGPSGAYARIIGGAPLVHIADLMDGDVYRTSPLRKALVDLGGARTGIVVALRKDASLLGVFTIYRQEVRPFSEKQIALLENFAAQAVIAMENARLITETREALEQQTATAEVLQVINSSPGDLTPVFDAILEKAHSLCGAASGHLMTWGGECFETVAIHGEMGGIPIGMPVRPKPGFILDRIARGEPVIHVTEVFADPAYHASAYFHEMVEVGGVRTMLYVALRREDALLGVIGIYNGAERPFTDKQIALLQNFAAQAVIAMENARLITETREALEQQTATAEVLQVINSSPGDLAPVFDAMLERAMRLCDAASGMLLTFAGDGFSAAAHRGLPVRFAEYLATTSNQPGPGGGQARVSRGENFVHQVDMKEEPQYRDGTNPNHRAMVDLGGARTNLVVPLRKDDRLLGTFTIYRKVVRPFSDKQIALLQNFAAQAVIAMENARLITETREALEQQTATADVLGVINSSPGDLAPVFDAMLEKAHTLCGAAHGSLQLYDGENLHAVATHAVSDTFAEVLRHGYRAADSPSSRALIEGERFVQIADCAEIDHPVFRSASELSGIRTVLFVPLRRDDVFLGLISAARREVRPFSDKQVALLENFSAQAVIAMENARLLTETREALEQQTATAEVLQVINTSPGDLAPVFDAMLDKATRLCEASFGIMQTYDGERFETAALHRVPATLAEWREHDALVFGPGTAPSRIVAGDDLVHSVDLMAEEVYQRGDPSRRALVDLGGARSHLIVALRKDRALLGTIAVYRQEVRPFTDKQIALLQNFAAQAVIAMENTRLITETHEALEQQTATAEVLGVINSSPGDLAPVFDAMLEKATRLCEAPFGILRTWDGERFHFGAVHGDPRFCDWVRQRGPIRTDRDDSLLGRIEKGERVVRFSDARDESLTTSPGFREMVEASGIRSAVTVALHKDDALLGIITVYRQEVRPFSDKQIALLQNFAAQAVIAIENARLLTETREALEQQTATAEVLQVINSSPGDLTPVFDAMLDKALRLCSAAFGVMWIRDGDAIRAGAIRGATDDFAEFLRRERVLAAATERLVARAVHDRALIHIADVRETEPYRRGVPLAVVSADQAGIRTILMVPMSKEEEGLGLFTIYRQEVRPFSDKEVALVENFAAQAVIAMENARLITELRQRTHDLQESLEYQTATSDVLKVISQSGADLEPVLETLVETAARLCEAEQGYVFRLRESRHHLVASFGAAPEFKEFLLGNPFGVDRGTLSGRTLLERQVVHLEDAATDPEYTWSEAQQRGNLHTGLGVPLLREDTLIGVLVLYRSRVEQFSEKQIALVTTFADQAVIAIENARLINELRQRTYDLQESLEYQTATSDVLKVISQSTFDLEPVLQTVLDTAMRLCGNSQGEIFRLEDGVYRMAVGYGMEPGYRDIEAKLAIAPGPDTLVGRTALAGRPVQIVDALSDPDYQPKDDARIGKLRSMLGVPLLREGVPIGVICTARTTVEPFTDKQIALVTTFADQAVIAIENARLFNELRARTTELGSSVAELKMLNEVAQAVSSTLDLRTVLSTVLNASLGVTWANAGAVFRYSRAERAFRLVEAVGWDEALTRSVQELRIAETESAMGEAAAGRVPIQLPDLAQRASYPLRDITLAAGFHSALIVPLLGAERILGAIILMRQAAGEFPSETVRLMQTLASQSVLAIQNARLFREIADKSEQLALASQHKSQFLANMSHELRTPLNAILGYAELLVDGIYGILPDRPKGVLERIQNNGKHLLALINDVLDLAKIEAGQLTLTLEDYSLPELVRSVVTATEPLATSKGLKFIAAVQDDLPMAHGDARRVSQVLLNLVGNAIKFTDEGQVEIRADLDKGQFVLTVRDTGPGIADADQERIFGEFQQIDNTNTRKKGGTGLGLAISKRMVEMQGGTISVDSVLGLGSTFRVVLPVHVDEMMEAA
jgi:GAF domain-containing protein/HAMP domain-containing protein/anti-sigma regulatory factor (Ser/Thr protein kinase)